jgi:hypothetical protein
MQTSSNQLARDSEAGFEKEKPKEEKLDLPYEAYFRILILDGNEVMDGGKVGLRTRLLDMSRFGCRIACTEALDLTEGIDSLLEGCIESPRFQFDRRLHGFIVRQDEGEGGFEYAIQFNHSLNVDFVHSFLYAAHVVKSDVRHFLEQEVPDHEAMALRYRIRHTVSKLMPHLQELDHSLSIYNYELKNEHREAIPSILYKEL